MEAGKVLVIDDEPDVAELIGEVARMNGFTVQVTTRADVFKSALRSFLPTVVVMDLQMPDADGIELIRFLAGEKCNAALILISGMDAKIRSSAMHLGRELNLNMVETLQKPVHLDELESVLKRAVELDQQLTGKQLADAISNQELVVYYQPRVILAGDNGGKVVGSEALVRWSHPQLGLILPQDFLPLAEQNHLMQALTDYVIEESLRQTRQWRDLGLDVGVSINIPASLLGNRLLPDQIMRLLNEMQISGTSLTVELTETSVTADVPNNIANLTRLRVKNVNLAIDDFGTGYSSLVQIYKMPFNELKIDKSFVIELDRSKDAAVIVTAIVNLAHELGLIVCAEGVESESAFERLCKLGCEIGQGYFISPPLPPGEFLSWLDNWQGGVSTRLNVAEN